MIKALLFDVFGTVVDWRSSVISECKKLENETNVKGNWEKLTDMWRQKYIPSMDKVRYGKRDWVILDILHKESLISILDELDTEIDIVEFVKLNVDNYPELSGSYGIMAVPTVIMFQNGEMKDRFSGVQPKEVISESTDMVARFQKLANITINE